MKDTSLTIVTEQSLLISVGKSTIPPNLNTINHTDLQETILNTQSHLLPIEVRMRGQVEVGVEVEGKVRDAVVERSIH